MVVPGKKRATYCVKAKVTVNGLTTTEIANATQGYYWIEYQVQENLMVYENFREAVRIYPSDEAIQTDNQCSVVRSSDVHDLVKSGVLIKIRFILEAKDFNHLAEGYGRSFTMYAYANARQDREGLGDRLTSIEFAIGGDNNKYRIKKGSIKLVGGRRFVQYIT